MNARCPDDAEGVPAAAAAGYPGVYPRTLASLGLLPATGLREEDGDAARRSECIGEEEEGGSAGGLLTLIAVAMAPHPSGEAGGSAYPAQV